MSERPTDANEVLANMVASRTVIGPKAEFNDELGWPCLLMLVGEHWFGVRADYVREVVVPEGITRVPAQPDHILGVSLVHGRLVPVIDIGKLLPTLQVSLKSAYGRRLAVLSHGESEVALVADEAKGVIELPVPDPKPSASTTPPFVLGEVRWDRELVTLFDAAILIGASIGLE